MNLMQRKINESYILFKDWWESIELTNCEKYLLNKEIINFNQQLVRVRERKIRIGAFGKAGVGKSSILNNIVKENFFKTGILNGSTLNLQSKELTLENSSIKTIELLDSPGFDICNPSNQEESLTSFLSLDLILFITSGDLNRKELDNLLFLIKEGKNIIIILNKIDIWTRNEVIDIKNKIMDKLPLKSQISIITYSSKTTNLSKLNKIYNYLKNTLERIGYSLLIYNTYRIANKLALSIKETRLIKGKHKAQTLIGKFATLKASSVALNPLIFFDIAGSAAFDALLINELSRIYGFDIKGTSALKLIKSLSFHNVFLGVTQVSINTSFNLIKKLSLIFAPFTSGLSLLPYGTVAIVQAALAVHATKLIGKLATKEILEKSKTNNLEPFKIIQEIAFKEPEILVSNKFFLCKQNINKDYSIFIP